MSVKKFLPPSLAPKMTLKNKVSVAVIRRYDYLFSDVPDLVSSRLAGIINSSALVNDVRLIRIDVTVNGEGYNGMIKAKQITPSDSVAVS